MFLDESASVIRKARARTSAESSSHGGSTPITTDGAGDAAVADQPESSNEGFAYGSPGPPLSLHVTRTLSPPSAETAMGFFFTHFVLKGVDIKNRQFSLTAPSDIYDLDPHLLSSMQTVGLASLAGVAHSPGLMKEARLKYIEAIHSTNKALRSAEDSVKDSSLLAITLLSVFESITSSSLGAWEKHVNGTVALIKLRGSDQFSTVQGIRLYAQATHAIISKCGIHGLALPQDLLDLDAEAAKYADLNDPAWRMHALMLSLTNLRAAWKADSGAEPQTMMTKALQLDKETQQMFTEASPAWNYQVIHTGDPEFALTGCYHIYPNYMAAQIWNGMRTIRIVLNAIIRGTLLKGFSAKPPLFREPEHTIQFQNSTDTLSQLQLEIIASTPQHMGRLPRWDSVSTGKKLRRSRDADTDPTYLFPWTHFDTLVVHNPFHRRSSPRAQTLPMVRIYGGYSLPWAVYMAGATDVATEACRSWAINTLGMIGGSMGIQQAVALAEELSSQRK